MSHAGDAAVDDLQGRADGGDRGAHLCLVEITVGEVLAEDERDLGLDLGLEQELERHDRDLAGRTGVVHVVEQDAEVGLVDAQLGLDGRRGEPDLATDHASAGGRPVSVQPILDGIGRDDVVRPDEIPDGPARDPGAARLLQPLRGLVEQVRGCRRRFVLEGCRHGDQPPGCGV